MSTMQKPPLLDVHNLTVVYQHKPAIWNIDCQVPENRLTGIVGPNGSGKTTLLKAIMGLVPPSTGEVRLWGQPLDSVRTRVAYVPQRGAVDWDFPITVLDVVLMGRIRPGRLLRRYTKNDREQAFEALRQVKLEEFGRRQIGQLSGGQQQRVFIARAIAQQADVYFLDEPFAAVDMATEETIVGVLRQMEKAGKSIFVVHHDLHTVHEYFDWAILLNTRLVANGPVNEVFTPEYLQLTYGAQLSILSEMGHRVQHERHPLRDDS